MNKKALNLAVVGTNFISDYMADAASLSEKCTALAIYSRSEEKEEEIYSSLGNRQDTSFVITLPYKSNSLQFNVAMPEYGENQWPLPGTPWSDPRKNA